MWPPLLRILLDEPALLAEHAAAYSALIRQEAMHLQARLLRRLGYLLLLGGGVLLAVMFAGIALMLHAADEGRYWLLWTVPLMPLAVAAFGAWRLQGATPDYPAFSRVRAQVADDMQLAGWKKPQ
ncbi:MAG: hypothetical protein HZY77_14865 [Thiobacillus sp.]|jgi:hypothetical protein|uniref:hypothetical protein n=1 Tax=Thiobacillus sp. TaxID=924 RepID=UPI00168C5E49|nr:hypothetical protein [Thiobacillus sp.]QLQ03860.1 MAG: hypothetical protein HZY77_14865 [Thiobacillus sp.]